MMRHGILSWRPAPRRGGAPPASAGGALAPYLPQGRTGQAAALCLTLAVALLAWYGAVLPARQWYVARQERLQVGVRLLAHERALIAALPRLAAQAAAAGNAAQGSGAMLPGRSDALAAAALQGDLQMLAQKDGVSLDSAETLPAKSEGVLRRIGIRVRMTTSYDKLVTLMSGIATTRPLMLTGDLSIHSTGLPGTDTAAPGQPVMASFTVSGFRAGNRR